MAPYLLVLVLMLPGMVAASVKHTVSFPENRQQVFLVRSEFPVMSEQTELIMPNWTPGSYLIRDYAANVDRISAVSGDGSALRMQKVSKDRWLIDTESTDTVVVSYEVFTPDLSVQSSWASSEFSLINGASVFLYTEPTREMPQNLHIVAGSQRGEIHTAMAADAVSGGHKVDNYDELVDNPVAVANAPSYRFTHKAQDYVLLNVGENAFWDGEQAARDVKKIVAETQSFWGSSPLLKPYWFLNFIVEAGGGLEHDHSTVLMTGRRQMSVREDYVKWLGLVSHEFFHVWNVRRMRPAGLAEYDYQQEQYTRQLWLAEGLSSYYDNLLLSRAGLISPKEYLDLLAADIYRLETTPGRLVRPVTEASFDAWVRRYQPNSNSINSDISYYTKGAVIGLVLDAHLRMNSKGRRSLDDVMQTMYSLYSSIPYERGAFEQVVADIGGQEAGQFLRKLLTTTLEVDVDAALDWYGLKLDRGIDPGLDGEEAQKSDFGVNWEPAGQGLIVKSVLAGSGASVAGLLPGDEVLAIDDERLSPDTLEKVMGSFRPGDETVLLISRRGKVSRLELTLDAAISDKFKIGLRPNYKKSHLGRLQSLLGQALVEQ